MAFEKVKRSENYSEWYNNLVKNADMAEHADVKGCMVIKPYGYAIWEKMQAQLDKMFKKTGHVNAYFPLLIPKSFFEKEEKNLLDRLGIKKISTKEIRSKGAENIVRSTFRYLADCTDIYLSFDVDSLDSAISRGTGTPVINGLKEREAEDLVATLMQNHKICCLEITEVNPTLDKENLMAEIAFNILQRSVNQLLMN